MSEMEVVSEPAPILVIQVVKMSAKLIFPGFSACIFRSFSRKLSEEDRLLSSAEELVWPSAI